MNLAPNDRRFETARTERAARGMTPRRGECQHDPWREFGRRREPDGSLRREATPVMASAGREAMPANRGGDDAIAKAGDQRPAPRDGLAHGRQLQRRLVARLTVPH